MGHLGHRNIPLLIRLEKLFAKLYLFLTVFFKINKYPFSFLMHILCTTGSLHCGLFKVFSYLHTHLSSHCGHVQLCVMSVKNPLVTPIYNGSACVHMVFFFLQKENMCVLKDIVHGKIFLDETLTSFNR